jgi:hypothetical protein
MRYMRWLVIVLLAYAALFLLLPRYQTDILKAVIDSPKVHESAFLSHWIDGMTRCQCDVPPCACQNGCSEQRRIDWTSPYTITAGVFSGTLAFMPFPPRHIVFLQSYAVATSGADVPEMTELCGPSRSPMSPQQVIAFAALAMFAACLLNFALGFLLGALIGSRRSGSGWVRSIDRWGLPMLGAGFLMPFGFPIGLACLYVGFRRSSFGGFLLTAGAGSICHVVVLVTAFPHLATLFSG